MTTIYNYIMRKINQFEDYLLQPAQPNTTKHNKHKTTLKSPEYYNKVIDELQQQIKELREQLSK